jgi:hypothetical protein
VPSPQPTSRTFMPLDPESVTRALRSRMLGKCVKSAFSQSALDLIQLSLDVVASLAGPRLAGAGGVAALWGR